MKKARSLFLFTCCLLVAIGPLNVFQVFAWGNMINDYSAGRSITEATEMTFSGEYPCEMCRRIAEAKAAKDENPSPFQSEERQTLRLDLHCQDDSANPNLHWSTEASLLPGALTFHAPLARFQRVPTPPPQRSSC